MSWNILVTCAGGQYGSLAVDYIKKFKPDVKLFGLVHSPKKVEALKAKGVEARIGDFSDKASLIKAFQGINRLLFVSVSIRGVQKNVVEAAKECGISFIAYTSIFGVNYPRFGLEINHGETEQWIKESGIPYTFLRNNWYIDLDEGLLHAAKKTGRFLYTSHENKYSFALRREYAEVGAKVILREKNPQIINLARFPFTYPELAKYTEEALGKKLEIKEVTLDEFKKYLEEANVSSIGKFVSTNMQGYVKEGNHGEELGDPKEFEEILGRKLEPLPVIIKEYLASLSD